MFTFSFSSAFAATTVDVTRADILSAQNEAINTISTYAKLENYDMNTQTQILFVQADAIASVQYATQLRSTAATLKVGYKNFEAYWYTEEVKDDKVYVKSGILNGKGNSEPDDAYGVYDILNAYTAYINGLPKTSTTLAVAKTQALNAVKAYINSLDYTKFSPSTAALLKSVPSMAEKLINEADNEFAVTAAVKEVLAYVDSIAALLPDYAKVEKLKKEALAEVKAYANLEDYNATGKAVLIKALALVTEAIQSVDADLGEAVYSAAVGGLFDLIKSEGGDSMESTLAMVKAGWTVGSYLIPEEAISLAVKAYKLVVSTQVGNKMDPAKNATLKYQAEYLAYVNLLESITGSSPAYPASMEAAAGVTPSGLTALIAEYVIEDGKIAGYVDKYGKYLGVDGNFYYATAAEAQAAFNKAIAAVNKKALGWNAGTTTGSRPATAADKTSKKQTLKAWIVEKVEDTDYVATTVKAAVLNDLNASYNTAVAEIDAATTYADLEKIYDKYVGEKGSVIKYSGTKGIYWTTADAGLFWDILEKYDKAYGVEDWDSLVEWINANVVAEELWTTKNEGIVLNDLIADVYKAQKAGTVKYTGLLGNEKKAADYKETILNYFIATHETDNQGQYSVVKDFNKYYKMFAGVSSADVNSGVYHEGWDALDVLAIIQANQAYEAAIDQATKKATVRAAQEAYVAKVNAIKTTREKAQEELIAQYASQFEAKYNPTTGTAVAGKNYTQTVQQVINFYYKQVKDYYANLKADTDIPVTIFENNYLKKAPIVFKFENGQFKYVDALDELKDAVAREWKLTLDSDALKAQDSACVNKLLQALRFNVAAELDIEDEFDGWSSNGAAKDLSEAVTQYATDYEDGLVGSYLNSFVTAGFNLNQGKNGENVTTLLGTFINNYNMLMDVAGRCTLQSDKDKATNDAAFDKAVAALDAATTDLDKKTAIANIEALYANVTAAKKWSAMVKVADVKYAMAQAKFVLGLVNAVSLENKAANTIYFWEGNNENIDAAAVNYEDYAAKNYGHDDATEYSATTKKAVNNAIEVYKVQKLLAATQAEKESLAQGIIDVITSAVPAGAATSKANTAADLALLKTYASQFFAQYENKVFTSAATNKGGLRDDVVAAMSTKFSMADVKVTTKKILGKGIQVTCDVVPGATEYKFWRATSKGGNYKLMLTKTTNTYTNTLVTKGVKYFYKVTAVVNGVETEMTTHTGIRTW